MLTGDTAVGGRRLRKPRSAQVRRGRFLGVQRVRNADPDHEQSHNDQAIGARQHWFGIQLREQALPPRNPDA